MKKLLVSALAALAMVVGGFAAPAQAAPAATSGMTLQLGSTSVIINTQCSGAARSLASSELEVVVNGAAAYNPSAGGTLATGGPISLQLAAGAALGDTIVVKYVGATITCGNGMTLESNTSITIPVFAPLAAPTNLVVTSPSNGTFVVSWTAVSGSASSYSIFVGDSATPSSWISASSGLSTTTRTLPGYSRVTPWYFKVVAVDNSMQAGTPTISTNAYLANGGGSNNVYSATPPSQSSVTTVIPQVPVFKQPKFAMPSKIDVDTTGKVSLSGKDMGVSTVLIGGKEQKIDTNSDEKLVFDTTGLAKGVHDLVMKGAFGTYTIQKAIQVGEAVVTKVAAVSARQVGMAGGELSISGVGLEGSTQITMNGQVLEIVSRTDSKVTFKVPASTVASVNSIMIEGSFVPVLFKNAFSYTK